MFRFASATALALIFVSPAYGQDAAGGSGNDIVVTGLRASNERAVAIKRDALRITDTVSATEIGQLPDFNAGDALKRVTGVNTLLYQGEPRFVIVRGFNQGYNDLLVDGFSLASTDINMGTTNSSGRVISMEVLPSNIASHIDVIKTATPETDANFIGGLTNFVTPSAFDFPSGRISGAVSGGPTLDSKGDGGDHFTGQAQLSASKRFGEGDQFGIYLSGTYWTREINVPQIETGSAKNWYDDAGKRVSTPYGGNGYAVPGNRLYYNYANKRTRSGLQGRFDWKPDDTFSAYASGYYFHQTEESYRHDLNAAVQNSATNSGQTATSGTLSNVTQSVNLGQYRWYRDVAGAYGRFDKQFSDTVTLDGGASWSTSKVRNPQTYDSFSQNALAFDYDTSGSVPLFSAVNAANAADASRYISSQHREEAYRLRENRYDAQLNLRFNSAPGDYGLGAAVGARFTAIRRNASFDRYTWTGLGYSLADVTRGKTLCGYVCDTPIPVIDRGLAASAFAANAANGTGIENVDDEAGGTYSNRENVWAGYAQVQYRADNWYAVAGLRMEDTTAGSSGLRQTNGVYAPITAETHYTNWLPSALLVVDTFSNGKLRLGVSETVSRPSFMAASVAGGVLNTTAATPTLSTGNPDLKPRRAWNLDIGHDWYVDGGRGILSIAGFYKWISDDYFNYGELQSMQIDGVATDVLVTQSRNTQDTVRAYGIELGASYNLSFLPAPFDGLGISGNATFSRAHFPITLSDGSVQVLDYLPQQANEIYNVSLVYDKGSLHGRLAWNHLGHLWDDRYPNFTADGFYRNRYQQPTDNIDLQLSYDVTPQVTVTFDALNVTGQGQTYMQGNDQEILQSAIELPTQLLFGVKVRM
nr:TonB-dependent receptor [uncultured Novosphingobium sp.]